MYPEAPRKKRIRIVADQLIWLARFHHAHEYYYLLGFDRMNEELYRQKNISGRACVKMITRKELQFHEHMKDYEIATHDKFVAAQYMLSLGFPVPRTLAVVRNQQVLFPASRRCNAARFRAL